MVQPGKSDAVREAVQHLGLTVALKPKAVLDYIKHKYPTLEVAGSQVSTILKKMKEDRGLLSKEPELDSKEDKPDASQYAKEPVIMNDAMSLSDRPSQLLTTPKIRPKWSIAIRLTDLAEEAGGWDELERLMEIAKRFESDE